MHSKGIPASQLREHSEMWERTNGWVATGPDGLLAMLVNCRVQAGLTQKQVADKLGVSQKSYQFYESGRAKMTPALLWQIADALGVSLVVEVDRNG